MIENAITRAKLSPLQTRPNHIQRRRLLERIASEAPQKLTLVAAPAGCGKSTLLSDWLQTLSIPWAIVSLDPQDDDLAAFAWVVVSAIRASVPDAMVESFRFITQAASLEPVTLAAVLVGDLDNIEPGLVVVLDNYHELKSPEIHDLIALVLRQLPDYVQLVIATRTEPPIPIAALRARGELTEIRADELRFNRSEVEQLVSVSMAKPDSELASMLLERTEGWAAGLQLYLDQVLRAQSLRKDARSAWLAVRDHMDHFLVEEMVANYPDEMRAFLIRTSILGQFSGPLCDAVLDTMAPAGGSTAMIQRLRQENCLLEAVGSSARWYRYHRLLRTVLEDELRRIADSSEIDELHRRASLWLADNAFVEQAVYHANEIADVGLCAHIVANTMETLFNRDDWPALDRALSQLTADVVHSHPDLLLARAWILHFRNRYSALTAVLDQFEERIQSVTDLATSARYRGNLATLRGFHAFALGDSQGAISHGQQGLELLPGDSKLARGISSALIGMGSFWAGRGDESERELLRLLESEREPHPAYRARVLQAVSYLRVAGGNLVGLEQSSRQLIALSAASDLGIAAGWGHLGLGIAAYERNDLDAARQHFSAGIALRDRANGIAAREARLGLAQVSLLLGSQDMARGLIASAIEASELAQSPADLAVEYSFQARLKLAEGRLEEAVPQLRSLSYELRPTLAWAIEAPAHTRVRILLAQGDESHLHEALEIVETLAAWYESHHEAWRLIQVRALQALTLRALGREAESLDALAWALEMAAPRGLLRTFLDLGPPMAALLNALPRKSRSSAYHTRLLIELRQIPTQQLDPDEAVRTLDHSLYEALTWREIEILQLLEARLSNKEIAGTLSVSVETVKKHAANIYRKLNVQGRRQAVNRGHDLRILSGAM